MSESIRLINPTDESVLCEVPLAGREEVDAAIADARKAAPDWRDVAPSDRARLMRRFAMQADRGKLEVRIASLNFDRDCLIQPQVNRLLLRRQTLLLGGLFHRREDGLHRPVRQGGRAR